MSLIKNVIIFGGTHGNEWTGVYAVTKYAENFKRSFPNLNAQFIHANPEAFKINRRFKDEDLNRAFQFLHEDRPDSFEHNRAIELKKLIVKEECFLLDLHTTTSNMGNTVIITHDHPLNFFVAEKLTRKLPNTRVIFSPDKERKYLASQSKLGMMIEVGPVANGVLEATTLTATLALIEEVLQVLSTQADLANGSVEIYEECEDIFYPLDETKKVAGFIHPDLQGKDFHPLNGSYKAFQLFSGIEVVKETRETLYPIFVNEAAYYPVNLAYTLCRRKEKKF